MPSFASAPASTPSRQEVLSQLHPTPCGIVRTLVKAGYEAYIVGGAIRDLLTGNPPKDYDICTSATPEEVRKVFGRRRCHVIGRRFRLAHVYSGGELYEVSTFRRLPDEEERHGRKDDDGPQIWNDNCYGTLEEDAQRRDFSCNALYFDVTGQRGIIDLTGGLADIRAGLVRCLGVPRERIAEDPVRMLRALKLVGQFGFHLEPALEAAIREQSALITAAAPARLFEELLKILNHPAAGETLAVMHRVGFLRHYWPVVDEAWDDQEGEMMRYLLHLRGDAIRRGHYSNSRGLALATVSMPFLMSAMNPENPLDFWERSLVGNETAHRAVRLVFEGLKLPRVFEERVLAIAGMVPKLMHPPVAPRVLNNAEYRYSRALVALLAQLFGWDQSFLRQLPEFSPRYDLGELVADEDAEETADAAPPPPPAEDGTPAEPADDATEPPAGRPRRRRRRSRKAPDTAVTPEEATADTAAPMAEMAESDNAPASTDTAADDSSADTAAASPRPRSAGRRRAAFEDGTRARRPRPATGDGESITFG